jgi:hypothetical protein
MGVTVKYYRGAWWVFVAHRNQRKAKRIGASREAAKSVAQAIEEQLARVDLGLPLPLSAKTLRMYAETWLTSACDNWFSPYTGC